MEELGVAFAEVHVQQAEIASDAMGRMHDRITGAQLRQVAQPAFDGRRLAVVAAAAGARGRGVEFGLGQDREIRAGQYETGRQGADPEGEGRTAIHERSEIGARGRLEPIFA